MRLAAGFVSNQELSKVVFYPPLCMDHFDGLRLKEHMKGNGRPPELNREEKLSWT